MRRDLRLVALFSVAAGACTFDFEGVGPTSNDGGNGNGGAAAGAGDQGGDPSNGASGAGGDEQGGSMPTDCVDGTCLPIPEGFLGPIRLEADGGVCGDSVVFDGGVSSVDPIEAPPAQCGCNCALPAVVSCGSHQVAGFPNVVCVTGQVEQSFVVAQGGCQLSNGVLGLQPMSGGGPATGTCISDGVESTKPPWSFTTPVSACTTTLDTCVGSQDACVPNGKEVCVYTTNPEAQCPTEGFSVPTGVVRREDVVDSRDCVCNCGSVAGVCAPRYDLHPSASCGGSPVGQSNDSGCISRTDELQIASFRYAPVLDTTQSSCPSAIEVSTGDAAGPATLVCCTPLGG